MQMDEFICQRNIEHFRKLLATMQDDAQRRLLLELLAAEEAKLWSPMPKNRYDC